MNTPTTHQVTFAIDLGADDISAQDVAQTIADMFALLSDIEKGVRGRDASTVAWMWAEDRPKLEVVASVNGVSQEELGQIVADARQGFASVRAAVVSASGRVNWPESFGPTAQRRARSILRRIQNFDVITVHADGAPPLVIEAAEIGKARLVTARLRRRLVYSVIEGRLDLISQRGRLRATITEHGTNYVVHCSFVDSMMPQVMQLFAKRVIAEGLVNYRHDGVPISITDITSMSERRSGRPLEEFVGISPELADGLPAEDFIDRMREDG